MIANTPTAVDRIKLRLVFLDFDGVLNSSKWWRDKETVSWTDDQIDPRAVALLNELAPSETTRIVVSSTWRLMGRENVTRVLEKVGVKARVVGVTPDLWKTEGDYRRGKEIAHWLSEQPESVRRLPYVIIDDDHDAGIGHGTRFIKTDVAEGLTRQHVEAALASFKRQEEAADDDG